jgi:hypothetical protein
MPISIRLLPRWIEQAIQRLLSTPEKSDTNRSRLDLVYTLSVRDVEDFERVPKGMKFYSNRELCSLPNYKTLRQKLRQRPLRIGSYCWVSFQCCSANHHLNANRKEGVFDVAE